jgi:hypothetical protein
MGYVCVYIYIHTLYLHKFCIYIHSQSILNNTITLYLFSSIRHKIDCMWGHAVAQLVEALRYEPEGRGFDFRWCHWNFSLT